MILRGVEKLTKPLNGLVILMVGMAGFVGAPSNH